MNIADPPLDPAPGERTPPALDTLREPAPAKRNAMQIGNLDKLDFDEISGWVWDPDQPNAVQDIEILDRDVVLLRIPANTYRPDLEKAGMGDGRHGFSIRNLHAVLPYSRHHIRIRRASDGRDLPRSPHWLIRPRPGLDSHAVSFMQDAVSTALERAQSANDIAPMLNFLLGQLNSVLNYYHDLSTGNDVNLSHVRKDYLAQSSITGRTAELTRMHLETYPVLHFSPAPSPVVTIVIPVHNHFAHTYNCLKSISEHLPRRALEIVIVDDCSSDETLFAPLAFSGAVKILRNEANLGFVRSCNAGAAQARGHYLFFLNNDTLVRDGWLDELVQTFEQVPNIGIAGSKLLFEDGTLQEAGGIVWRLGDGWNWGRGHDPADPRFMYLRDADWVSGAALMIERELFHEVGGFDELYAPGYYEDTDLAFQVRSRGKRVVVQPASEIVHLEGVSAGTDTNGAGMKRYQVINHSKFYNRWKSTLLHHRFNGESPDLEAERLVTKRAIFIDDGVPTPDQDAGSNASLEHMRALMGLGYKVTFLPAESMANSVPYTGALQKLGIECLYYPTFSSVEEVFRKFKIPPEVVYLYRYTNAAKYASMIRRYFPNCWILYSVCDLHFLRKERELGVTSYPSMNAGQVALLRRMELMAMEAADSVIVHSTAEADLLASIDQRLNVTVVPWTVHPKPTEISWANRSGCAFVGGFGHPPNVDAVEFFTADILPQLQKQAPLLTTYVIGSRMPDRIAALRRPGLVPVGFVPELSEVLNNLRCTIAPLRYGAGIKGKVLESFAHGLPCVMSEVAAEGLAIPKDMEWLIARHPGEFVEKVVQLHTDQQLNQKLASISFEFLSTRFSFDAVSAALKSALLIEG